MIYNKKLKFLFLCLSILIFFIFTSVNVTIALEPQPDFGVITKIVAAVLATEHYNAQKIANAETLSEQLFNEYLKALDPNQLYFTQKDIDYLSSISENTYENLKNGDISFAFASYNLLMKKVRIREDYVKELLKHKFDFKIKENYEFDRSKAQWAKSEEELNEIWRKKIKNDILTYKLMEKISKDQKNKTDKNQNLKKTPQEHILAQMQSYRINLEKYKSVYILELYLSTLASLYDPHSSYMSPQSEENFNIQMQLSFVGIGALLSEEEGYVKVEELLPGGPAEKSGLLKPSDRIIAITQEDGSTENIIDVPLQQVVEKIRGKKGTKVTLTILEASQGVNAIPKEISLVRDEVKLKDYEATGRITETMGASNKKLHIGIIDLPSFYYDFQGAHEGKQNAKSSSEDVKKILDNFIKQHIDGVIIDLRSNGGGSLKEAIALTGLFINDGPIVQTRDQNGNVYVEDDPDTNAYYTGPLLILTNKLSASAAEIFAGAIQDYGRGIIVGDESTHGKGTVQTVLNLNDLLSRFNLGVNLGALKLTNAKFYRITGSSTQNKGVVPDIVFDSLTDYLDVGESRLEHALPWDSIKPTPYTKYDNLDSDIMILRKKSEKRQKTNSDFMQLNTIIILYKQIKDKKDISLNEKIRWNEYLQEKQILDKEKKILKIKDNSKNKTNDVFISECLKILSDYISLSVKSEKINSKKVTILN